MTLGLLALTGRILLLGVERILVKKLGTGEDPASTSVLFLGLATIFLLPPALFVEVSYHPVLWLTALSGLIYAIAFYLYVKSLSIGEASLVSPLYNYNVFFLIVISSIFLNEPVTGYKVAGTALLVYSLSLLNRQSNFLLSIKAVFRDTACRMMIACSLLVAVARVIDGFIIREVSPLFYAFIVSVALTGYLLIFIFATGKAGLIIKLFKKKPGLSLVNGAVNAYSYLLLLLAFTEIDVSVAEPASMLSMIVTVTLAKFIFKEKIRDRMIGVAFMIAGAWFLFQ